MRKQLLFLPAFLLLLASASHAQTIADLTMRLATPEDRPSSVSALASGKVTVLSFWATWCKPCKEEMKAMQPLYEKLKAENANVEYIAVSIDNTKSMAKVAPFIKSKAYTFPVLLDPNGDLFRGLNGTEVPYTLVFAADGTLHSKHDGYLEGDEAKLEQEIRELLAKAAGSSSAPSAPQH